MGMFAFFSASKQPPAAASRNGKAPEIPPSGNDTEPARTAAPAASSASDASPATPLNDPPPTPPSPAARSATAPTTPQDPKPSLNRRFTLPNPLPRIFTTAHDPHKPVLSRTQDHDKRISAARALDVRTRRTTAADRRAHESALVVRALIVGPGGIALPASKAKPVSRAQIGKVKAQLLEPAKANRLIAHLRTLPGAPGVSLAAAPAAASGRVPAKPIHAVCLPYTEPEAHEKHFKRLQDEPAAPAVRTRPFGTEAFSLPSVATASIDSVTDALKDLHLVNLLTAPDLGLGQPADGAGLLAGAVPTAKTVMDGIVQITPQLMALGYATGKSLLPDHTGVYPPTDRMSVLTYWWGLELVLPPPTLTYLDQADSVSNTIINFLTAVGAVFNGVREILPFVRYIGQYLDFEFDAIKGQDQGQGVVCAATWIMPAAMVPRPWDFAAPPAGTTPSSDRDNNGTTNPDAPSTTPAPAPVPAPAPGADDKPSAPVPDKPNGAPPAPPGKEGALSRAPILPSIPSLAGIAERAT